MGVRFGLGRVILGVNAEDDFFAIIGCYFTSGLAKERYFRKRIPLCGFYPSESNIFPMVCHFSTEVAEGSQPWNWLT